MNKTTVSAIAHHAPLIAVVMLFLIAVTGFTAYHGVTDALKIGLYSPLVSLFLYFMPLGLVWLYVYHAFKALRAQEDDPFRLAWVRFGRIAAPGKIMAILLPLLLTALLNSAYTSLKTLLGKIQPFYLDPLLARLDRALHGGVDPWQLTHQLVSTSGATLVVDILYTAWFFFLWGFLFWQLLRLGRPRQRLQFFVAYALCWSVIGTLFAYLLASAGPCYYELATGDGSRFLPLMERLQQMKNELLSHGDWRDLVALNGQSYLRDGYLGKEVIAGGGISAMPSMHVSMAVLFFLSAWQANRIFGLVMLAYALIIFIGSVHLGWHYAVDGYLSVLLTVIIWILAGRWVHIFQLGRYAEV